MHADNRTLILVAIMLSALGGCASSGGGSPPASRAVALPPTGPVDGQVINIPVKILGADGQELGPGARPDQLELTLSAIPGSIGGHTDVDLETPYIGDQTSLSLSVTRLNELFVPLATPLSDAARGRYEISPEETRFVRVATGVSFKSTHRITMGIGFFEPGTKDTLTLMYFDRPCHLRSKGDTGEADIEINAPGWFWIDRTRIGSTTRQVRADSPHPVLLVAPTDAYLQYVHSSQ